MPGIDPDPRGAEWLRLRRTMEDAGLSSAHRADAERIWRTSGIAAALNYIAAVKELEASTEVFRG